ncbi:hypothetical protein DEO72_LG9g1503 [Vigna unguiculata]|uniref:Uncharacterized protein n=1 Tax=Vigna unguiculata TaxID=3917 RepID=A0A4D6MY91_VIGUN|nr:hypothetical protein DEO72_LG9g1503 [Vigna unguiculata]
MMAPHEGVGVGHKICFRLLRDQLNARSKGKETSNPPSDNLVTVTSNVETRSPRPPQPNEKKIKKKTQGGQYISMSFPKTLSH